MVIIWYSYVRQGVKRASNLIDGAEIGVFLEMAGGRPLGRVSENEFPTSAANEYWVDEPTARHWQVDGSPIPESRTIDYGLRIIRNEKSTP
jgi:hypothetical protein